MLGRLRSPVLCLALLLTALTVAGPVAAQQDYPSRTVQFIMPWPPGSPLDLMTRALAAELSTLWKQSVIVENVAGAGSIIGAQKAASAAPDGHTLMMTANDTVVHNRFVYRKLPYDPDSSFIPVSMLARSGQFVVAYPQVEASTLKELVELAKRKPRALSFGSFGNGTRAHLLFAMMNQREGIDVLHVPYKGVMPAMTALIGGEVQLSVASPGQSGEMIRTGRIKPLVIAAASRSKMFPEVPTAVEAGYPYLEATIWLGMFAPAGTSPALIEQIHRDATAVMRRPEFAEKHVASRGFDLVASTPAEFAETIKREVVATAEMVKAARLQPE